MTTEAKREYNRQWKKEHHEKVMENERNRLRRKYLADFLAERQKQTILGKKEVATNGESIPT